MGLRMRRRLAAAAATAALAAGGCAAAFPLLWMLLASFKSDAAIFRVFPLWPERLDFQYAASLFSGRWIPFPRQFANTFLIAAAQTAGALLLTIPAAFVFALHRFPLRRALYVLALTPVFLPQQTMAIPLFTWIHALGLYDTLWAVILPGSVSGIGILYFTAIIRRTPPELLDAARVDGASEHRLLPFVLPLIKPGIVTYGLIHFVLSWHEHLMPLILLATPEQMPLSVALARLGASGQRVGYAVLMAAGSLMSLPAMGLCLLVRRHFESTLSQLTGGEG